MPRKPSVYTTAFSQYHPGLSSTTTESSKKLTPACGAWTTAYMYESYPPGNQHSSSGKLSSSQRFYVTQVLTTLRSRRLGIMFDQGIHTSKQRGGADTGTRAHYSKALSVRRQSTTGSGCYSWRTCCKSLHQPPLLPEDVQGPGAVLF